MAFSVSTIPLLMKVGYHRHYFIVSNDIMLVIRLVRIVRVEDMRGVLCNLDLERIGTTIELQLDRLPACRKYVHPLKWKIPHYSKRSFDYRVRNGVSRPTVPTGLEIAK